MEAFLKSLTLNPPNDVLDDESDEKMIARAFAQVRAERRNSAATSQEGEEIVAQALDEAKLERSPSPKDPSGDHDGLPGIAFPSLPSHAPQESDKDDGVDEETRKKLNLLLSLSSPIKQGPTLPSAPKSLPSICKYDLPGYDSNRDKAADTWCCKFTLAKTSN